MIEKSIFLDDIDPRVLFGSKNILFDKLKDAFPKIKLIARGNELKAIGESQEIEFFLSKLDNIFLFVQKKNKLTNDDLVQLLSDEHEKSEPVPLSNPENIIIYGNHGKAVKARTPNQKKLVQHSIHNDLLFAIGPAGTGKTYTAIALAVRALKNREVKRIVLTRPAVEAGENLGFLPGDLKEKLDPYLRPLYDALRDMIPPKKLAQYIEEGTIEIAPLAFMRGRTLANAFVLLDEGQNTTINQLKMFLTRMGENAKFIVTGDITQIDLPKKNDSGLIMALEILTNINGIVSIVFDQRDIVRHPLVKSIVDAYDKYR